MFTTRSIITFLLLGTTLSTSGVAQTLAPAARPIDHGQLRHQIFVMEGALARAVQFGAQQLNKEIRSISSEIVVLAGEAQARGVYLDGYGVFFDVGVPVMLQSGVWSLRTIMERDDKGLQESISALRALLQKTTDPASRGALQNAILRLESQTVPLLTPFQQASPSARVSPAGAGGQPAASEPGVREGTPAPSAPLPIDKLFLQDPNRAYTEAVQRAIADAMIDYSLPMQIREQEWLTVAARDNEPRDSFAPRDLYEEVVTVLLRIRGGDIAAYRAGHIDRDEVRQRIQVSQF